MPTLGFESSENEAVDRVANPGLIFDDRDDRRSDRLKCPMLAMIPSNQSVIVGSRLEFLVGAFRGGKRPGCAKCNQHDNEYWLAYLLFE